jgi:hypothetical protein
LPPWSHQIRQGQEIRHAKARSSASDTQIRIGGHRVCPARRHRAEAAARVFKRDPFLASRLFGYDKPKFAAVQWMKRMCNLKLPSINGMTCI